jgi:hypothetical protein
MKKIINLSSGFFIVLLMVLSAINMTGLYAGASQHDQNYSASRHRFPDVWDKLNEEQKSALKNKIMTLWDSGASREEIHQALMQMLVGFGVDTTGFAPPAFGPGRHNRQEFFAENLTADQRSAIREKAETMRNDGSSREEIHQAVLQMLKDYGINPPEKYFQARENWQNLTVEQRQEIRAKIKEMRDNGASKKEIHQEVKKLLDQYNQSSGKNSEKDEQTIQNPTSNLSLDNFPNPFNPHTTIRYELKSAAQVTLRIYDLQGQLIRSLVNDYQAAGSHNIHWDGLNENGIAVPSGVYFIRMSADKENISRRIILTK